MGLIIDLRGWRVDCKWTDDRRRDAPEHDRPNYVNIACCPTNAGTAWLREFSMGGAWITSTACDHVEVNYPLDRCYLLAFEITAWHESRRRKARCVVRSTHDNGQVGFYLSVLRLGTPERYEYVYDYEAHVNLVTGLCEMRAVRGQCLDLLKTSIAPPVSDPKPVGEEGDLWALLRARRAG